MQTLPKLPFADRAPAARALAEAVQISADGLHLVLGLPRGGVTIAAEISLILGVRLDVFLVRKIGAPDQPELAPGALAETGHVELNHSVLDTLRVDHEALSAIVAHERHEIERRLDRYRGNRPAPNVDGQRVLVVDDGVATGATVLVALRALRAARLVLGTPVCPMSTLHRLQAEAGQVVVLATPEPFGAVGSWYDDFHQMSDDEVMTLLQRW